MENESLPHFAEICQRHNLDYQAMQALADLAGVPKEVVDAMSVSTAVKRRQATAVLAALSQHIGEIWTLSNVNVALLPTFQDLHAFSCFDLSILSIASGISFDTIDKMVRDEPISEREARLILRAAHRQTRLYYKFRNVDVKRSDNDADLDD